MEKSGKVFYWLPRILCILAILFVSMFALDSFSPELTIWQQIGGFLIHLIPSYILLALLLVAWKWEYIGGIIYTIVGLAFCVAVFLLNFNRNHFTLPQSLFNAFMVAFPFVIVGILFIISHNKRKKNIQ
jgi:hypothetical protein